MDEFESTQKSGIRRKIWRLSSRRLFSLILVAQIATTAYIGWVDYRLRWSIDSLRTTDEAEVRRLEMIKVLRDAELVDSGKSRAEQFILLKRMEDLEKRLDNSSRDE